MEESAGYGRGVCRALQRSLKALQRSLQGITEESEGITEESAGHYRGV